MFPGATYKEVSLGADHIRMSGSFTCNGASAVSAVVGKGFTVARTDTGDFTVSLGTSAFPTPYKKLISWTLDYMAADATVADLKINSSGTSVTSATAPKIVITNAPAGTPTDLTSVIVAFEFVFGTSELDSG